MDDGHLFGKVLQPKMGDVLPPELDFPLVWFQIFGHQVEQGGFATAISANQSGNFPLTEGKVQSLEHLVLSVCKG